MVEKLFCILTGLAQRGFWYEEKCRQTGYCHLENALVCEMKQ